MQFLSEILYAVNHIVPNERAAGTANGSAWIDTAGADEVLFVAAFGAVDNTVLASQVKIYESDDANGADPALVENAAGVEAKTAALGGDVADNVVALINVRLAGRAAARKRYMRATLANGGSGNGDSGVIALLRKHATPVVNSPVAVLV